MRVVDKVCITFSDSDVIIFLLKLLRRLLVHTVNIDERPFLRLPDLMFLAPHISPVK